MNRIKQGMGWMRAKFAGRMFDAHTGVEVFDPPTARKPASASVARPGVLGRVSALLTLALLALIGFAPLPVQAQVTNLVAYDSGTGAVTFAPGGLVTPIITGVIAAIAAGAALLIITVGIRWVYRTIKGSR